MVERGLFRHSTSAGGSAHGSSWDPDRQFRCRFPLPSATKEGSMKRPIRLTVVAVVALAGLLAVVLAASGGTPGTGTRNTLLAHAIEVDLGTAKQAPHRAQMSGGVVNAALDFTGQLEARANGIKGAAGPTGSAALSSADTQGCQNVFRAGSAPANVRVNQDCSLRRQAEEVIV